MFRIRKDKCDILFILKEGVIVVFAFWRSKVTFTSFFFVVFGKFPIYDIISG